MSQTSILPGVLSPQKPSPWNKGQLYSSASTDWSTPQDLFDRLDEEFGFLLDACASAQNAKCEVYISEEQDCLVTEWGADRTSRATSVWMNPPWGRQIGRFIQRAYEQGRKHRMVVACLLPACTDTKWWRDWVWKASEVRFVTGRLRFVRGDGHTGPSPKGAAVVVFTPWGEEGPPRVSLMDR